MTPPKSACVVLFAAGLGAGTAAAGPPPVSADHVHISATWCETALRGNYEASADLGVANPDSVVRLLLVCPVPTDVATSDTNDTGDNFDHKRAVSLIVHGVDRNDNAAYGAIEAQACITFYNMPSGGSCGPVAGSSLGVGPAEITPSVQAWTQSSTLSLDYPSLYIVLPQRDAPGASALLGYTVESM